MIDMKVVNTIYNLLKSGKSLTAGHLRDISDDSYDINVPETIRNELAYIVSVEEPDLSYLEELLEK